MDGLTGLAAVVMYAHYDVQPAEPLDEWHSPPFEPTERNNNIYARGAVDDKGQLWMEVKALEALMQTGGGKLPINVKVIFEGEEEVGGESIAEYIRKQKAKLKADFALVCDTELFAPDLPTLCVGLRGLVYTEIEAVSSQTDLHSGMYGGAAPNSFFGLIELISKMKDAKGKVLIPGFYKGVKAPTAAELKACLIDQRSGIQRGARIAPLHARCQTPKFFISQAEQLVQRLTLRRRAHDCFSIAARARRRLGAFPRNVFFLHWHERAGDGRPSRRDGTGPHWNRGECYHPEHTYTRHIVSRRNYFRPP